MNTILRKAAIWVCHGLVVLILFLLPSSFVFSFVFSQPQTVKHTIKEANIYGSFSEVIIDASKTSLQSISVNYGLSAELVDKINQQIFSPRQIEKKGDKIIDNTYAWLNGKTSVLILDLDLARDQQILLQNLAQELQKSEAAKPLCSYQQMQQIAQQPASSTIFQASCRPSSLDIDSLKNIFDQQSAEVVEDADVSNLTTQSDTLANQSVISVPASFRGVGVPQIFWFLKYSFYILTILLVLVIVCLYFLVKNSERFLRHFIKPLFTTGVLLAFYALLSQWYIGQNYFSKLVGGQQGQLLEKISHPFLSYGVRVGIIFGTTYALLGIALYILRRKIYKKPAEALAPPQHTEVVYNKDHD